LVDLIVVDQGSTDTTLQLLDSRGVKWIQDFVLGAGHARKTGLAHTTGELVLFLDSDDWLSNDAIATLVAEIEKSKADIVYGPSQNVSLDYSGVSHPQTWSPVCAPLASSTVARRTSFKKFGPFADDNYSWPRWITMARAAGIQSASVESLICFRGVHDSNMSKNTESRRAMFSLVRTHRESGALQ
jgi:glycosyltransferase involved in cell wall biosynthesis